MRHITLQFMEKQVLACPKMSTDRRPSPMPGKKYPTRVAWVITVSDRILVGAGGPNPHYELKNPRTISYIGKPNRYRALEARRLLNGSVSKDKQLLTCWQAEFDKEGIICYKNINGLAAGVASGAFFAYHPHSSQPEVVDAFTKPLHLKYIGGMRVYSQKSKLAQEAVDAYYEWYHTQFKKRLRRPKVAPMAVIAGEAVDLTAPEAEALNNLIAEGEHGKA